MIRAVGLALMTALWPICAPGQVLDFPANATLELDEVTDPGALDVAIGPYVGGEVPLLTVEGVLTEQVWRIAAPGLTTLQILRRLRDQLGPAGYETVFECATEGCGGFDFRFRLAIAPPPEMHVDLGDFRYLAARDAAGADYLTLIVSRSALAGFVQLTHVGQQAQSAAIAAPTQPRLGSGPPVAIGDLGAALEAQGRVILSDLAFATGSAQLGVGPFASLDALASYLIERPERRVALVGHTDSEGSLDGNIALSRRRAGSVLERLVGEYGVPRRQLDAQGMGYLAPVAPNLTEAGREANRRVEVIIVSTE